MGINIEPAWVASGAACAGAVAAWVAAINGSRTLRRARLDSRERSRPMLSAELRDDPYTVGRQSLVLRNHGPTIARDVRVAFDPEIPDPPDGEVKKLLTPFLKQRYERPIAVFPPGMELDNLWYVGIPDESGPGLVNREPTPDRVTVHLEYRGPDGTSYSDSFPLDVDLLRKRTWGVSSSSPHELAKDAVKAIKSIEKKMG